MKILGWAANARLESRLQNKESPATQRETLVKKSIVVKSLSIILRLALIPCAPPLIRLWC